MSDEKVTVGTVMGSDSDLKKMSGAASQLEKFGIGYDISIILAHRDPEKLTKWCNESSQRGTKVRRALVYLRDNKSQGDGGSRLFLTCQAYPVRTFPPPHTYAVTRRRPLLH